METATARAMSNTSETFETFAHYKIGRGHCTLSIEVDGNSVQVGMAFCYPKDQFVKSYGRKIALGRRLKGSFFTFEFTRNQDRLSEQVRAEFEKHALSEECTPPWVRFSLKRELKINSKNTKTSALHVLETAIKRKTPKLHLVPKDSVPIETRA